MKSKRQTFREKRRRQQTTSRIIWGTLGVAAILVLGYFVWVSTRPAAGEPVTVMADSGHVEEGEDPGPYNTDPPSSGKHFAGEFDARFYEESELATLPAYPEGYLVHNLEHGYVIFWYNCDLVNAEECADLKSEIKEVMDEENNFKVIAFPWKTTEVPVVMTSWGQYQPFERFDPEQALAFVRQNRNKSPEPNAP